VAIADLNGDGKPDLVAANSRPSTVSVLLGNGDGTFADKTDYPTGSGPATVAVGDMNGDGRLDVVTTSGVMVSVLLGNGDGSFTTRFDYVADGSALALGDLNGDGRLDLVVSGWAMLNTCR